MINPDKLPADAVNKAELMVFDKLAPRYGEQVAEMAAHWTRDIAITFLDALLADDEAMKRLKLALPGYTSEFTPDAMRAALTAAAQEDR
jgi:hypothetical protein